MPVSFIECSRYGYVHHLTEAEKIRTSACLIIFQEHRNATFLKQSSKKDMPNGLKKIQLSDCWIKIEWCGLCSLKAFHMVGSCSPSLSLFFPSSSLCSFLLLSPLSFPPSFLLSLSLHLFYSSLPSSFSSFLLSSLPFLHIFPIKLVDLLLPVHWVLDNWTFVRNKYAYCSLCNS